MSYEQFQKRVNGLISKAGGGINVKFSHDDDEGKHYARCDDGTTIIGNAVAPSIMVRWGSGHVAVAHG